MVAVRYLLSVVLVALGAVRCVGGDVVGCGVRYVYKMQQAAQYALVQTGLLATLRTLHDQTLAFL